MKRNKKGAKRTDQSTAKLQSITEKYRHSYNNINIDYLSTIEPYQTILQLIGNGEDNAVHLSELIKHTGLHNREVRKCIEQLRRSGEVIISSTNGYFRPETPAELKRYINQETHRAKSIFYTLKNARQMMKQIEEVK